MVLFSVLTIHSSEVVARGGILIWQGESEKIGFANYSRPPLLLRGGYMFIHIGDLVQRYNHIHDYTEWQSTNNHYWSHVKTLFRTCKYCPKDEYKLIEINCPQLKIRGEYCNWCKPYAKYLEERLEKMEIICDNEPMKKVKKGRPLKLAENMAVVLEHELYGKSFREIAEKNNWKDHKTAWMKYQRGLPFINLRKVKEAVG